MHLVKLHLVLQLNHQPACSVSKLTQHQGQLEAYLGRPSEPPPHNQALQVLEHLDNPPQQQAPQVAYLVVVVHLGNNNLNNSSSLSKVLRLVRLASLSNSSLLLGVSSEVELSDQIRISRSQRLELSEVRRVYPVIGVNKSSHLLKGLVDRLVVPRSVNNHSSSRLVVVDSSVNPNNLSSKLADYLVGLVSSCDTLGLVLNHLFVLQALRLQRTSLPYLGRNQLKPPALRSARLALNSNLDRPNRQHNLAASSTEGCLARVIHSSNSRNNNNSRPADVSVFLFICSAKRF